MNRTAARILIAVGAAAAAVAIGGAPIASAGPDTTACQAGQIVIDGQCAAPPTQQDKAPAAAPKSSGDDGTHAH